MGISSINGASGLTGTSAVGTAGVSRPSSVPPPPTGVSSANISPRAELMKKLTDLQSSDPAKFKEVASKMAETLRADASKEGGFAGTFLNKIADGLESAAQSGDLSQLTPGAGGPPPAPPGGAPPGAQGAQGYQQAHHHHHHHGGGRGGQIGSDLLQAFTSALDSVNGAATAATPAAAADPAGTTSTTSTT